MHQYRELLSTVEQVESAEEHDGQETAIRSRSHEGRSTDSGRWPRRTEDAEQLRVSGLGHNDLDVFESHGNTSSWTVRVGAGRALVRNRWP